MNQNLHEFHRMIEILILFKSYNSSLLGCINFKKNLKSLLYLVFIDKIMRIYIKDSLISIAVQSNGNAFATNL